MKLSMLVFVTLAIGLAASLTARADIWTKTMENGGDDGFYSVSETHSLPIIGTDNHTLSCINPGPTPCEWSNGFRPKLIGYAENQIDAGILSGSFTAVIGGVKCTVTWQASDKYNGVIQEVQEPMGLQ